MIPHWLPSINTIVLHAAPIQVKSSVAVMNRDYSIVTTSRGL